MHLWAFVRIVSPSCPASPALRSWAHGLPGGLSWHGRSVRRASSFLSCLVDGYGVGARTHLGRDWRRCSVSTLQPALGQSAGTQTLHRVVSSGLQNMAHAGGWAPGLHRHGEPGLRDGLGRRLRAWCFGRVARTPSQALSPIVREPCRRAGSVTPESSNGQPEKAPIQMGSGQLAGHFSTGSALVRAPS